MKTFTILTALWLAVGNSLASSRSDLVVHEWGTFTSVQGGDGVLLAWQPFVAPDLPPFVYDWRRPGLGRQMPPAMMLTKGAIRSLQRVETPVIYFYTDRELTAEVTVKFPEGFITEWYPQAQEVGHRNPSAPALNSATLSESFKNSIIAWRGLQVLPARRHDLLAQLPMDDSDNHYFAARETDSAFVRVAAGGTNGTTPELERLLFYRGTGNFSTPLKVTVSDDGQLSVANTGLQDLTGLFLIEMRGGAGKFTQLGQLAAGAKQNGIQLESTDARLPLTAEELAARIRDPMTAALVEAGLYPREAAAMVKTWSTSWFTEDGVRVLYLLPRAWTDKTLPITLKPVPRELVRVMVGRAEIITPALQQELAGVISHASSGDPVAKERLQAFTKKLGRFYAPAYQLASQRLAPASNKPVAAVSFD